MQIGMPVTLNFIEEQDPPTIPGMANAGSNMDKHIACAVVAGLVVARPIIKLQQDLLITVATRQRKPLPPGQSLILSPTLGLLTRNTSPRNPGEKLKEKGSEIIRALQYGEDYFTTELRAIATNE